jgi:hypothetical protein
MRHSGFVNGVLLLVLSGAAAAQSGCGTLKYNVPSSSVAPGADAKVTAEVKKKQHQTMLEVTATNLIPPSRVQPDGVQYVAWYRHDPSGAWSRIGTLDYDEDARKAILAGSVPETAFDLQISVEPGIPPTSPSPKILFSQRVED